MAHALSTSSYRSDHLSPSALALAVLLHAAVGLALWWMMLNRPSLPPAEEPIERCEGFGVPLGLDHPASDLQALVLVGLVDKLEEAEDDGLGNLARCDLTLPETVDPSEPG